jgi:hypothetical protein
MATTIAINVGDTSVNPGGVGYGNVVLTEDGSAAVTVTSVRVYMATGKRFVPIEIAPPQGLSTGGAGVGNGFPLAQSGSVSLGFQFPAMTGTLTAEAVVSDGSMPTATQAVTVA